MMAIDPVCKMEVGKTTAKFDDTSTIAGRIITAAPKCKNAFEATPQEYIG